jgi:hypothetical protein
MKTRNIAEQVIAEHTTPNGTKTEFLYVVWRNEGSGYEGDAFTIRTTKPSRPNTPFLMSLGQHLIGPLREALVDFEERVRERHSGRKANLGPGAAHVVRGPTAGKKVAP